MRNAPPGTGRGVIDADRRHFQSTPNYAGEFIMSVELVTVWAVASHIAELVTAHGLVEAGKRPMQRGARAVIDWLNTHLPEADKPKLAEVTDNAAPGPAAQAAL